MKVLQINTVYGEGSTGKIAKDIHDICVKHNIECLSAYRCRKKGTEKFADSIEISSAFDSRIHGFFSRLTMFKGCFSYFKTLRFLRVVKKYSPDLIHLHNLHGSYVNLPLLFRYVKRNDIHVVWTLHDCWPFTAICSHFTLAKCNKWIMGCNNCPKRKEISLSPIDFTRNVWRLKKKWFTGLKNVTIVTPSLWLENIVKQSFLKEYPVKTIHNGIDLNIFKHAYSDFKVRYNLQDEKIVLGVTFGWGYSKGLDVMIELSKRLPDDYKVILVGTDSVVDNSLPDNIISIHRTNNQSELAEIYSAADVFVNPTREDNFPTVNMEALACGTPVITFETGGSPECIDDTCGVTVKVNDIDTLEKEILRICTDRPFSKDACVKHAEKFNKNLRLEEYIELYKDM